MMILTLSGFENTSGKPVFLVQQKIAHKILHLTVGGSLTPRAYSHEPQG